MPGLVVFFSVEFKVMFVAATGGQFTRDLAVMQVTEALRRQPS